MTGQELFEALSFVDERYIHEAETARLRGNLPWGKILPVAACLCMLLAGAFMLESMGHLSAKDAAPEAAAPAAAPEAMPEAAPEAAPPMPEEEVILEAAPEMEAEPVPAGELQQIPYARLCVTEILAEGSYTAVVEELSDAPTVLAPGQQLTLVVDSSRVPGADAQVHNDLRIMHEDAQIEIQEGAYDAEFNILYVSEVVFLCRGDH